MTVDPSREPTLVHPVWQRATQRQCESEHFLRWCEKFDVKPAMHRKLWEHVYIMRCLEEADMLGAGKRGLGFGVGKEQLVRTLVRHNCDIVATDYAAKGWSNWHASSLADLGVEEYAHRVELRQIDMREVPEDLRQGEFDFVWSSCAMKHLGSIPAGFDFVRASLQCLKPGGVAVHTTELCTSSNDKTLDKGGTVLYRARDMHEFFDELYAAGHDVSLNMTPGTGPCDIGIVSQFQKTDFHLNVKIQNQPFVTTSFGLYVRKPL